MPDPRPPLIPPPPLSHSDWDCYNHNRIVREPRTGRGRTLDRILDGILSICLAVIMVALTPGIRYFLANLLGLLR